MAISPLEKAVGEGEAKKTTFSVSEKLFEQALAEKQKATEAKPQDEGEDKTDKDVQEKPEEQNQEQKADKDKKAEPGHTSENPAEPWIPKTAQHWKQREKAFRERETALQAEITALKAKSGDESLKKLRDENQTLKNTLKEVAIERDPEFQAEWQTRQEKAMERLKSVASENSDKLAALASLPPNKERDKLIDEILKELPPWQQAQVGAALLDVSKLGEEKATLLKQHESRIQKYAQRSTEERQAERQAQEEMFEEELGEWQDSLGAFDKSKLESSFTLARAAFMGDLGDSRKLARFTVWGALGPLLAQDNLAKEAVISELRERIKALEAAQPDSTSKSQSVQEEVPDASAGKRGSFGMTVAEAAKKQGLLAR